MKLRKLLLLALLAVSSCSEKQTRLTDEEKSLVIRDVRLVLENYYEDIRRRGLTAEFDYLDSSAEFFWVPPGSSVPLSFDSIRKVLTQNASLFTSIDSSWDTLGITPLSTELAVYTGRLRSTSIDTSGLASTVKLVETGLVIKRAGGWKLLSGQTAVVPVEAPGAIR